MFVVVVMKTCRICLESDDVISVCACDGTAKWVHFKCVQEWVRVSKKRNCELCLQPYQHSDLTFYKTREQKTYDRCLWANFPLGILSGLFLWLDHIDGPSSLKDMFWYYISVNLIYQTANCLLMFAAFRLKRNPIYYGIVYNIGFVCGCIPGHVGQFLDEWSGIFYATNSIFLMCTIIMYSLCGEPAH